MTTKTAVAIAVVMGAAMFRPSAGAIVDAAGAAGQSQRGWGASTDRMIERAFEDTLRRAPDQGELRRYRVRVDEDHWNADDIKADLRERRDHMTHGDRTTRGVFK